MNCMIVDDNELSTALLRQLLGQIDSLHLVKVSNNPLEAVSYLKTTAVDLLFLDIEMPEMTGFNVIKSIERPPLVIFTTSHSKYAVEAFDCNHVIDYLVKPFEAARLLKAVEKAKLFYERADKQTGAFGRDFLFLKKDSLLHKVPVKDIEWIEAQGDYVTIHTAGENYTLHITLKAVEKKLPADKFLRIHRSYIIQLEHIGSIDDNVVCIGKKLLPVGSLFKDNFMTRLNLLF
jgi:DNA-binding LytR/AlgR family response regulator